MNHEFPFFISSQFSFSTFVRFSLFRLLHGWRAFSLWKKGAEQKKIFHISAKDSRFSSNIPLLVGANETLLIALLVLNTRQLEIY